MSPEPFSCSPACLAVLFVLFDTPLCAHGLLRVLCFWFSVSVSLCALSSSSFGGESKACTRCTKMHAQQEPNVFLIPSLARKYPAPQQIWWRPAITEGRRFMACDLCILCSCLQLCSHAHAHTGCANICSCDSKLNRRIDMETELKSPP